jgi:hypothetical protein
MFDIEASIRTWRETLLARAAIRAQDVDELEDHLREELARLRAEAGPRPALLDEEESFLIASRRLGHADALAGEFARAHPAAAWRRRWIWMLAGYLGIGFAFSSVATLALLVTSSFSVQLGSGAWLTLHLVATLLVCAALFAAARFFGRGESLARWRAAHAGKWLTLPGVVLAAALAIVVRAAMVPMHRTVVTENLFGVLGAQTRLFVTYSEVLLWICPGVILAVRVWRDRARRGRASGLSANEA